MSILQEDKKKHREEFRIFFSDFHKKLREGQLFIEYFCGEDSEEATTYKKDANSLFLLVQDLVRKMD